MADNRKPQSGSGKVRKFSVGDFLLEVDEVLRPLIDLTALLQETHEKNPDDLCCIPYRDLSDAIRAQTRLHLLLRDPHYPDIGNDITISRRIDGGSGVMQWA